MTLSATNAGPVLKRGGVVRPLQQPITETQRPGYAGTRSSEWFLRAAVDVYVSLTALGASVLGLLFRINPLSKGGLDGWVGNVAPTLLTNEGKDLGATHTLRVQQRLAWDSLVVRARGAAPVFDGKSPQNPVTDIQNRTLVPWSLAIGCFYPTLRCREIRPPSAAEGAMPPCPSPTRLLSQVSMRGSNGPCFPTRHPSRADESGAGEPAALPHQASTLPLVPSSRSRRACVPLPRRSSADLREHGGEIRPQDSPG